MMTSYRPLVTLQVMHAYHPGAARYVEPVLPAETVRLMERGRILARAHEGGLQFFFAANRDGSAQVPIAGAALRVGLRTTESVFGNVTDPASLPPAGLAHWRNGADPARLDAWTATRLVGAIFEHTLADATAPVTVSVESVGGDTLWSKSFSAGQPRPSVSIDLSGAAPGALDLREVYAASTRATPIFLHPELARESPFGVVDVTLDPGSYTAPTRFEIALGARSETLRYYVVADKYTPAELAGLTVLDAGATADNRVAIAFDRVAPPFAASELATAQLGGGPDSRYVLFRSQAPVARRERARTRIELHHGGDVLIPHLPQPRPHQSDANLVIHVGK
jgi:hypothetical protein